VAVLNKGLRWVIRIVIYGVAAIIIVPLILFILGSRLEKTLSACHAEIDAGLSMKKTGINTAKLMASCLENNNSFLESWLHSTPIGAIKALPNTPCQYVGVWISTQTNCRYKFILKENGEYDARHQACNISSEDSSGSWGVHENKMLWFDHDNFRWPPDINTIEAEDENSFTLVELNGSRTRFVRTQDAYQTDSCKNPTHKKSIEMAAASAPVQLSDNQNIVSAPAIVNRHSSVQAPMVDEQTQVPGKKVRRTKQIKPIDLRYCLAMESNHDIAVCANARQVQN
jgi:hypothetical protein